MIDATALNLIGIGEFGQINPIKTYRVRGQEGVTFLKADRHPNAFKMIPIINGRKGSPFWIPRHLVSA